MMPDGRELAAWIAANPGTTLQRADWWDPERRCRVWMWVLVDRTGRQIVQD